MDYLIFIMFFIILLVIDFLKLNKDDKGVLSVYLTIVLISAIVVVIYRYQLMPSPLEILIEKMEPITKAIETKFK
ncbi:hypothetical protein [Alkaliphilus serpentinus]|uniref:Uncharacterized protein n=1 Tax=Alkaliphilus serpentinus TaxID=1482731 RepID=A0A833M8H9_9FIRM|nr:hypothetical protein [Alkaliphilus serpentinus]KAB3531087.1 hypothetical protein F8153_05480 [Alkaliphilus serpentinus]